ncbi:HNH endonuclease [uncultured Stenotrophomonas sp.]|uniref:HNH endonuclease n=1 Tax=uncultured Stenotrophomonas sp. TaxID=165438 RepID=UPI0028E6DF7D|nr:HNH endonuclease [uncultured Stenotrophomonas sp.]
MKAITFHGDDLLHVQSYDGVSHEEWDKTTGPIVNLRKSLRDHYLAEQSFRCAYCRSVKKETHGLTWDVEHVIPKSTHAKFMYEPCNLAMACKECNISKGNKNVLTKKLRAGQCMPTTPDSYVIIHPHYDAYSDHIEITNVDGKITHRPKNPHKGKETYLLCDLVRFAYKFAEWENFDVAIVDEFSRFVERCPTDATPAQIGAYMRTLRFTVKADF